MDTSDLILNAFVIFGSVCVFATFGFMMPLVGKTTAALFSVVMGEQLLCKIKGTESGTVWVEDQPEA